MGFAALNDEEMKKRLAMPKGRVKAVLDTDAYNEVDDQFAMAYMLLSPEYFDIKAIYAAPFFNHRSSSPGDGMEKSYNEILRILMTLRVESDGFAFKGSDRIITSLDEPVVSPAALDLIKRAMDTTPDDPLYVIAIGAITNIASALLIEPKIHDRIVLLWLSGQSLECGRSNVYDFNTLGDMVGARFVYDSGLPIIQMTGYGVTSHLLTTIADLEWHLKNKNKLCDVLIETFRGYTDDHYGWSKELWDVGAIAYFINPGWFEMEFVPSLKIADDNKFITDAEGRHLMLTSRYLNRNAIMKDLFSKLSAFTD